jgi:hypothetical protein
MVDFLEEIRRYESGSGPRCGVASLELKGEILKQFVAASDTPSITSAALAKWLQSKGHRISKQTIQRHRRGDCRCAGAWVK